MRWVLVEIVRFCYNGAKSNVTNSKNNSGTGDRSGKVCTDDVSLHEGGREHAERKSERYHHVL